METKVKDLTIGELRSLISDSVKEAMEDLIEDILALSSPEYLRSIKEARSNYKEGKFKFLLRIHSQIGGVNAMRL